ncbi:hypothetical protein PHISCL_04110 [Aspergillus sclerotialis]|uniref:Ribonuclease H2 subunit B n=1 Tax=Aspergillus sclerotialis TaxID=2070753 RepID=A0A3A2ZQ25_9EURO|nr:hypothetical protein PHISCL_04110 [Aspergillus sclerotialis]
MRTRSTAPSKGAKSSEPDQPSKILIPAERPSKTFILPKDTSNNARFLQLPNPRTGELTRYYFCPKLGVYEFTVVAAPSHSPRSILFVHKSEPATDSEDNKPPTDGSICKTAELLTATPIDFVFFLIPLLSSSGQAKSLFQPLDDIIDSQDGLPKHLRYILYNDAFREVLQARAEAICDSVEAGDEKMFRFSEAKLLKELITKAERMVAQGIPASLEERFIRQPLVTPMMAVKRQDVPSNGTSSNDTQGEEQSQENQETSAIDTPATSTPTPSGEETPASEPTPDEPTTPENVIHLLRISTALSLIKKSYLSKPLCDKIDAMLGAPDSPIDFKPLTDHLKYVADLRAEALASRSLGDFTRKRGLEDEDAAESRAEKKRRLEEEEKKKKAGESKGVKDLKKVNTSGMKKMSDFFSKASAKKS